MRHHAPTPDPRKDIEDRIIIQFRRNYQFGHLLVDATLKLARNSHNILKGIDELMLHITTKLTEILNGKEKEARHDD